MRNQLLPVAASLLAVLAMPGPADARDQDVRTRLAHVIAYPDGATVTRSFPFEIPAGETSLVARDFPLSLDPQSLRVEGAGAGSGGLSVLGVVARALPGGELPAGADEMKKRLDALKLDRESVQGRIDALTTRKSFAERYARDVPLGGGKDESRVPFADWQKAFAAIGEELDTVNKSLIEQRVKLRAIEEDIARVERDLRARPATRMEVRVDVAADAPAKGEIKVTYAVRGARWTPVYDARLDMPRGAGKPSLELVRRAEIAQQTGEDWTDVSMDISTMRMRRGTQAPRLDSVFVEFRQQRPPPVPTVGGKALDGVAAPRSAPAQPAVPQSAAEPLVAIQEAEAQVSDGAFDVVWRVPGRVSVASGPGTRSLRLDGARQEVELSVRVAAALDTTAYLEAAFKHMEDAPLLPGRVALYREGTYVGDGRIGMIAREEPVKLGFGADERIKVTRTVLRRMESQSGVVSPTKAERQELKIALRNGRDAPVRITVEDRIPQSETQDIQIEMLPNMTPPTARDVGDKRGVLAWTYELGPGEAKDIRFGWRLRWPADKQIGGVPRS